MNEATPETEGSQGLTEDQGVSKLLEKWSAKEKAPQSPQEKPEQTAETPPEEETEVEQPEGQTQTEETPEEEPAAGEIEIDVGGAKFKAPAAVAETFRQVEAKVKEIEAGATRKFQEASDLRKAVELQS